MTLVSLDVWEVPTGAVPAALWQMATGRGRLRRAPGVRFAKLLGTGKGSEFGPSAADLTRWAALVAWDDDKDVRRDTAAFIGRPFTGESVNRASLLLRTVASRGKWAGREPFSTDGHKPGDEPILVLTRARLRPAKALTFWRSISPVARTLGDQDGLLAAFGVGEAPLGFQGTVSVWRSATDVARFAYRRPEHAAVVARTPRERWYAEELFARFAVLDVTGDREVIGWRADG